MCVLGREEERERGREVETDQVGGNIREAGIEGAWRKGSGREGREINEQCPEIDRKSREMLSAGLVS